MTVHNHGTEEGEGLACPESRLPGGQLKGRCMSVSEELLAKALLQMARDKDAAMAKLTSEGINNPGTDMDPVNYQQKALKLVKDEIDSKYTTVDGVKIPGAVPPAYELYVVWFAKVLQNWKALVSTDMLDGAYYEVTYNGDRQETYIDVYGKRRNIVIQD